MNVEKHVDVVLVAVAVAVAVLALLWRTDLWCYMFLHAAFLNCPKDMTDATPNASFLCAGR